MKGNCCWFFLVQVDAIENQKHYFYCYKSKKKCFWRAFAEAVSLADKTVVGTGKEGFSDGKAHVSAVSTAELIAPNVDSLISYCGVFSSTVTIVTR